MKKRNIALLMAAMMSIGMAGCGSAWEAEETKTEAPAAEAETETSGEIVNADGFYAGRTVEMIVPWAGVTVDYTGYDEFQDFYWENHESVKAYYEANANM